MPTPRQREKPSPITRDDFVIARLNDIKDNLREVKDELREVKNELRNVTRHSQIMTASVVGIALAVIYFVFTH